MGFGFSIIAGIIVLLNVPGLDGTVIVTVLRFERIFAVGLCDEKLAEGKCRTYIVSFQSTYEIFWYP